MNNPVWQDPKLFKLWMLCLLEASHKEHDQLVGKQIVKLQPGQFITGRFSLSKLFNEGAKKSDIVPESTVWRWLKWLEKNEFLNIKSSTKFSVITIKNWNLYQQSEHQMNNKRTANEQQMNTNNNGNKGNNDNKNNTTTTAENPVQLFEQLLCRLSPIQMNSIYQWVDDFKGNVEIINAAIKLADDRNKRNFGFVEFLLKEWFNNNLMTIDRVRAYEQEKFNKNKVKQYPRKGAVRTEMLPDWFDENEQKDKPKLKVVDDTDKKLSQFEQMMEQRKKMNAGG
ncbi:DnaD domain protein [Cytobacillus horneckiae]|uniref:DnaD domain-containing protein n=1 Tax=Cytobacillus horneckiae TaxID=549687 RepID=UPI0034CDD297